MRKKSVFDSFRTISTKINFYRSCLKQDEENMKELSNMIFKRVFENVRDDIKISKNYTRFVALIVDYDVSEENLEDIKNRFQNGEDGSLLENNFKNVHAILSGDFYDDINSYEFFSRGEGEFPENTMCIFFYCCPNN